MEKNVRKNRLASEKSPYLLQHSHDLVEWYSWGQDAFDAARTLDRPVLLSIGYSACHWCHVMGSESFSDPEVARIINEYFVAVKLDREEHPDLDNFFIKAVTAIGGSAGWPMTVFLTPDKQPFYGGSYFPPQDSNGIPGLTTVLTSVVSAWRKNRGELLQSAQKISELVAGNISLPSENAMVGEAVFRKGYEFLLNNYDQVNGGFGTRPKFPTAYYIQFLLRYYKRQRELYSLEMAEHTLDRMARGGIRDRISGGFHRYSTDELWLLPHFEKMLYDQALVSRAYLEAYQVSGNNGFASIARETIDFTLDQLQRGGGGFFSSLDADSVDHDNPARKSEGAYYLWTKAEIAGLLERETELFCYCLGVKVEGNIHAEPGNGFTGKNMLYEAHTPEEAAAEFNVPVARVVKILASGRKKLRQARDRRPWPAIDDKILCDWNALMISSLCLAFSMFRVRKYRQAAEDAAGLILDKMRDERGRLYHRYSGFEAGVAGMLDDYAFFCAALLDLYEALFDIRYLKEAVRTAEVMIDLFWDKEREGLFINSPDLIERQFVQKEYYDAAIPSGSSVALTVLMRLYMLTGQRAWSRKADALAASMAGDINLAPYSYINVLISMFLHAGPMRSVVVAATSGRHAEGFINSIRGRFLPDTVTVVRPWSSGALDEASKLIPFIKERAPLGGRATAYVCEDGMCRQPVSEPGALIEELER